MELRHAAILLRVQAWEKEGAEREREEGGEEERKGEGKGKGEEREREVRQNCRVAAFQKSERVNMSELLRSF